MDASERMCARSGAGPLLQRDYWAVIDHSSLAPSQFGELLATRFGDLAPRGLVRFRRADGTSAPLAAGDELEVDIRFAGTFRVRVIHTDANSLTLATLQGHPEAGRITFGAYRHASGGVIFHIRSRARASNLSRYTGFVAFGEPMQTKTWTDFVARVASFVGRGVVDFVYEETSEHADEPLEEGPTFIARGD